MARAIRVQSTGKKFPKVEAPAWEPYQPQLFEPRNPLNYYRPFNSKIDDDTILTFGPHIGLALINVPAGWLLGYNSAPGIKNAWLIEYIELRIDLLKTRAKEVRNNEK